MIPTRYGARVADAAGPVQGQTKPIVTVGIKRLRTNTATVEIRSPKWGTGIWLVSAYVGSLGLLRRSIRIRKTAAPQ